MRHTGSVEVQGDVIAEGRTLTPQEIGANLRKHGCPEHLVQRQVARLEKRAGITPTPSKSGNVPAELREAVALLRKAARAMQSPAVKKALAELRETPYAEPYDYKSLRGHADLAMQMCEGACAMSETIDDILNGWHDEATDENSRAKKSKAAAYRAAHSASHAAVNEACDKLAMTRSHLERMY